MIDPWKLLVIAMLRRKANTACEWHNFTLNVKLCHSQVFLAPLLKFSAKGPKRLVCAILPEGIARCLSFAIFEFGHFSFGSVVP